MTSTNTKSFRGVPMFIVGIAAVSTVTAQNTDTQSFGLEEIVVTAERRTENLQDIPKQVQVVTAEALTGSNVTSLVDLIKLVPSMSGPNSDGMLGQISMRGVGTAALNNGAEQKVGIVIDGIPIPSRVRSSTNLLDIEQVEILPGPQGTLAGRNATGGLVNMSTRQPSRDGFTATYQANTSTDHETTAGVYVSAPASDTVAWSLSGNYQDVRGMAYNAYLKHWDVATRNYSLRGKLLWAPDDDKQLAMTYVHAHDLQEGGSQSVWGRIYSKIDLPLNTLTSSFECAAVLANGTCNTSATGKRTFDQLFPGYSSLIGPDNVSYYSINRGRAIRALDMVSFKYDQSFAPGELTVLTSYLFEDNPNRLDWQNFTDVNLDLRPDFNGYANAEQTTSNYTFETHFVSNVNQPFRYIGGVFASKQRNEYDYKRLQQPSWAFRTFDSRTTALFGNASYTFPSDTTLRAGLRYERDKISYTWTFIEIPAVSKTLQNGIVRNYARIFFPATAGDTVESYVNYDVGLQQKFGDNKMVYASYGYANQGPIYDLEDQASVTTRGGLSPLPAEEVSSIEAGFKSTWFNNRVSFNINAFLMKFENYQALTNVRDANDPTDTGVLKVWAAGKVSSKGVELNSAAQVTEHFRLNVNGMYDIAKVDDWKNAPCYNTQTAATGCLTGIPPGEIASRRYQPNIAGNRLAGAPELKLSTVGTYSNKLFGTGWDYDASLTVRYLSDEWGNQLGGEANNITKARTYLDGGLTFRKNRVQIALTGINLTEKNLENPGTTFGQGLVSPLGAAATAQQPDGSYRVNTRSLNRNNIRYFTLRMKYSY